MPADAVSTVVEDTDASASFRGIDFNFSRSLISNSSIVVGLAYLIQQNIPVKSSLGSSLTLPLAPDGFSVTYIEREKSLCLK